MADLVTKIVDCVRVRDQTVIACYRLSHEVTLGPSSPLSQGQQVVAPRETIHPLGARKTCCRRSCLPAI